MHQSKQDAGSNWKTQLAERMENDAAADRCASHSPLIQTMK